MTTGAVIQARMSSTRLPGKVLLDAAGKPLLSHLIERLRRCKNLDAVIVATSSKAADDAITDLCEKDDCLVFRGSELDVLDRYYRAAKTFKLDTVVRITADCPLIDPSLVDEFVDLQRSQPQAYDLITNRHPLTFADGLDVDVMPFRSLETAWANATSPSQREHTIPYFWESGARILNVSDPNQRFLTHRWTLDYWEDYLLIRAVFGALYPTNPAFDTDAVVTYLQEHPEIREFNAAYLPMRANA